MPRDPRSTRRYRALRAVWLRSAEPVCHLCGADVDTTLAYPHPWSATVEHTIPVRTILAMTDTWDQAVAMCCDQSAWRMAHSKCQQRQGASAGGTVIAQRRSMRRRGSRDW